MDYIDANGMRVVSGNNVSGAREITGGSSSTPVILNGCRFPFGQEQLTNPCSCWPSLADALHHPVIYGYFTVSLFMVYCYARVRHY